MNTVWSFAIRNIRLFFRNKSSVFFSLLSGLIIIVLYVLFLREVSFSGTGYPAHIVDSWIMSGVVGVTCFTAALGACEIIVTDKSNKIIKDLYASPVNRWVLVAGYILSTMVISIIMSLVTLFFAQIYVLIYGGKFFGLLPLIKSLLYIIIGTLCSSSIVMFIASFVTSSNTFAVISTIIGTLLGFISGVYFPIVILPEAAQWVVKIFPISHIALLVRQAILAVPLAGLDAESAAAFRSHMGVEFKLGDFAVPEWLSVIYLLVISIIFFGITARQFSRKNKEY